jgi:serine/threonine protein kinase
MRAQAQLDHENLVRAFDAGRDRNVYYLATEYVPGTDLRKFVRTRTRLSMQEAATIISQAAEGLAHAHSRGMIHRDVKPGNLLVTPSGHTKVSDLGLAGFAGNEDDDDPRAGKVVGTADYLSPEQIRAPRSVTPTSDIYSLGCTLYYAVTGKVPFPGGTSKEKALRHLEEPPLNPQRINPELTDEFVEVLSEMMEKDPKKRVQTCAEVVRRLAPWARDAVQTTADEAGSLLGVPGPIARPAIQSQMSDTRSGFFDDFGSSDTPSQISSGSGNQDTIDDLVSPLHAGEPAPPVISLLAFGVPLLAAGLLLVSLLLELAR